MGTEQIRVSEGTLELRRHFETPCESYMGGNTLESMQQWSPSNLTVDALFHPKILEELGTFVVVCIIVELRTYMLTYLLVDNHPDKINTTTTNNIDICINKSLLIEDNLQGLFY